MRFTEKAWMTRIGAAPHLVYRDPTDGGQIYLPVGQFVFQDSVEIHGTTEVHHAALPEGLYITINASSLARQMRHFSGDWTTDHGDDDMPIELAPPEPDEDELADAAFLEGAESAEDPGSAILDMLRKCSLDQASIRKMIEQPEREADDE